MVIILIGYNNQQYVSVLPNTSFKAKNECVDLVDEKNPEIHQI
jgi:hypothetical protein